MSQFNYLAVDCGYVDRLEQYVDDMEFKPLFLKEYDEETNFSATEGELTKFKSLHFRGAVVFKCSDYREAYKLVRMLQEYDHCGCFSLDNMEEEQIDDVLIMKFDTESG